MSNKNKKKEEETKPLTKEEERERLIQIAVRFLLNPELANSTDEMKKSFLKKKGLKDDEIVKAQNIVAEKKKE